METTTIWVCENCMYANAYGETLYPEDPAPLTKLIGADVSPGIMEDQHSEYCELNQLAGLDCDCAHDHFSSKECEGCEQTLAGERHALTLWDKE